MPNGGVEAKAKGFWGKAMIYITIFYLKKIF